MIYPFSYDLPICPWFAHLRMIYPSVNYCPFAQIVASFEKQIEILPTFSVAAPYLLSWFAEFLVCTLMICFEFSDSPLFKFQNVISHFFEYLPIWKIIWPLFTHHLPIYPRFAHLPTVCPFAHGLPIYPRFAHLTTICSFAVPIILFSLSSLVCPSFSALIFSGVRTTTTVSRMDFILSLTYGTGRQQILTVHFEVHRYRTYQIKSHCTRLNLCTWKIT